MNGLPDNASAPCRGQTYYTIFAVLYGLGLRVGEVSRLTIADVDLDRRFLVIRETKFGKTRLVPFGPRLASLLTVYRAATEARRGPLAADRPFFSFTRRGAIHPHRFAPYAVLRGRRILLDDLIGRG